MASLAAVRGCVTRARVILSPLARSSQIGHRYTGVAAEFIQPGLEPPLHDAPPGGNSPRGAVGQRVPAGQVWDTVELVRAETNADPAESAVTGTRSVLGTRRR